MYLQSKPGPLQRSYELLTDYEVNPCRKVFILNVGMLIWQQNNPSLGVYVSVCRIVRNAAEMLLVCRVACLKKFKIWFKHRASPCIHFRQEVLAQSVILYRLFAQINHKCQHRKLLLDIYCYFVCNLDHDAYWQIIVGDMDMCCCGIMDRWVCDGTSNARYDT